VSALDSYTANLWSAVSVCKLLTSWTGGALRVIRTSDDASRDAGFQGDGTYDIQDLLTWAAGAALRLDAFFNQQGVSAQGYSVGPFASARPVLTADGTIEFNGSTHGIANGTSFPEVDACTIFVRGRVRATPPTGPQVIAELGINFDLTNSFIVVANADGMRHGSHKSSPAGYSLSDHYSRWPDDETQCFRIDRSQGTSALQNVMFDGGVKLTRDGHFTSGTLTTGVVTDAPWYIGSRNQGSSLGCPLDLHTLVIYSAALSDADCTAISEAIMALPEGPSIPAPSQMRARVFVAT
jgi:hypothetical protein